MLWMSSARPLPKPTANIMPDVHFVFQIILADQNIKQKTKKLFLKKHFYVYSKSGEDKREQQVFDTVVLCLFSGLIEFS